MITIAASPDPTSDFPIMFFKIELAANSSLFNRVADQYFSVVNLLAARSTDRVPNLLNFAAKENVLALLLLQRDFVGNIIEIQDYTDSPNLKSILFSGAVHINARK